MVQMAMKPVLYYKGFAVFSLHLCGIGSLALELVSLLAFSTFLSALR